MHPSILACILLCCVSSPFSLVTTTHAIECIEYSHVRTFEDVEDLQANKVPFDPRERDKCLGNYVGFKKYMRIETIKKNSFIAYDSEFIWNVNLKRHDIRQLDDLAFFQLDCLHTLDLSLNRINQINRQAFTGLTHLHELDLSFNVIDEIGDSVFDAMPLLKILNLSQNNVKILAAEAFWDLSNLNILNISHNYLTELTALPLKCLTSLRILDASANEIDQVEPERWHALAHLEQLDLTGNMLLSFDTSNDFAFNDSLSELLLGSNCLTTFNSVALRDTLRSLKSVDITDNLFSCEEVRNILHSLEHERVHYAQTNNDTGPNLRGVSCNRTMSKYKQQRLARHRKKIGSTYLYESTSTRSMLDQLRSQVHESYSDLYDRMRYLTYLVFLILILMMAYIVLDLLHKKRVLNVCCRSIRSLYWRIFHHYRGPQASDQGSFNELMLEEDDDI